MNENKNNDGSTLDSLKSAKSLEEKIKLDSWDCYNCPVCGEVHLYVKGYGSNKFCFRAHEKEVSLRGARE